ncbi:hypothetical protein M2139_001981 [Enterococcus sp. PF1-24]|uniref:hypothetical protein n=1 Tax=unclassified Enterococcus TaxID=2608891 RepID=UPI00247508BE|nr:MULTISPECIES: hypothetical protein [unclassified Enterococcus]MDH6364980.1 hypothetical protein [Enterococcus sp. PFB1-1]MDH6402081.1 hypothetical protein [Enterococcus sp. PF1-24]
MNTVVEISDILGLEYYYATIKFIPNAMLLTQPAGIFTKWLDQCIILSEIEDLRAFTENGIAKISFYYNNVNYTFIDYGNDIISFLEKNL